MRQQNALTNENNVKAAALAQALKNKGQTLTAIATQLNKKGFKTRRGKTFIAKSVQRLLEKDFDIATHQPTLNLKIMAKIDPWSIEYNSECYAAVEAEVGFHCGRIKGCKLYDIKKLLLDSCKSILEAEDEADKAVTAKCGMNLMKTRLKKIARITTPDLNREKSPPNFPQSFSGS